MPLPAVVSEDEWQRASGALRAEEKAHMRAGDALAARRRRLPAVAVTKDYTFDGPDGAASLLDLFAGRSQLIVYSFMLSAEHPEPCSGCSMVLDNLPHLAHLHARDTTFAVVARATLEHSEPIRQRMGWELPWYSAARTDFQADVGAFVDGHDTFRYTCFVREGEQIVKTYATSGRGVEVLGTVWAMLDSTVYGRRETWEDSPEDWPQSPPYQWWKLHTEYPAEVAAPVPHAS